MSHWIHPEAENEAAEAAEWYAQNASRKIAQAFLEEFERALDFLVEFPDTGTRHAHGLRVHPLKRFPYSLIHEPLHGSPRIYAIAHRRRKPGYWLNRIRNEQP